MSGGGGTRTTQTQSTAPWAGVQPYLKTGFEKAQTDVLNRPLEYFPRSTVVPFSRETETALAGTTNRALQGSSLVQQGGQQLSDTLGGTYLRGGNPAYAGMVERSIDPLRREFQETIRPGIASRFSEAGRGGSNIASQAAYSTADNDYMRRIGDIGSRIAFGTYEAERGRQQQGLGQALDYGQEQYRDAQALAGVGAQREQLSAATLDDEISRYNFAQNEPLARLNAFQGLIAGSYGGEGQRTERQTGGGLGFGDVLGTGIQALGFK